MPTVEIPMPNIDFEMSTQVETKFKTRIGNTKYGFIVTTPEPLTQAQTMCALNELFKFHDKYIVSNLHYPDFDWGK